MWDGVDRRRFVRAEYPCLITLRKNTVPAQAILTHTEDISVGGVQATISQRIEVMTEADLEIDLMDTLPTMTSRGMISWVKELPLTQEGKPTHYNIGIKFIALKHEDRRRIQNILDHLLEKPR